MKKITSIIITLSSLGFSWTANHHWETGDTITWNVPYQSQKSFRNWTSACMPTGGAMIVNFFYSGASYQNFNGVNHVWNEIFNINHPYQTTGQRMYAQGIEIGQGGTIDTDLKNYLKNYPKSGIKQYYNTGVNNQFGPLGNERWKWGTNIPPYQLITTIQGSGQGLNKNLESYMNKKHSIISTSIPVNIQSIKNHLYSGPILISIKGYRDDTGGLATNGHILVIKGINSNGNFIINDPWGGAVHLSPNNGGEDAIYEINNNGSLSKNNETYYIKYAYHYNVKENFTRSNHPFSPYSIPVEANVKFKYDGSGTLNNSYDGDGDYASIYNGFSIWNPKNDLKYYHSNGLGFLYAKTTTSDATNAVRWTPTIPKDGQYQVLAGFLANSANSSHIDYTIYHTDGENIVSINQQNTTNAVESRNNITYKSLGSYCFDAGINKDIGSVHLSNQQNKANKDINIDIMKFVYKGECNNVIFEDNTFNGTGSIVATTQTSTIGGDQDIVALQAGSGSMGSFQWYQEKGYCPNLLIANRYNNAEVNEVLVVRKGWGSSKISTSFETKLPFSLSQREIPNGYDGVYDTILIKSLSSLNKRNQIVAICRNNSTSSSSTTVSNPDFKTKDGYTWAGNGSIISQSLSGTGIGKTEDYAYRYSNKKALTIFQWQPSSRCKKLKISASYYDYNDGKFHTGKSFNGKLSTKVWKLDSYIKNKEEKSFPYTLSGTIGEYYMLEIRTEETMNSKYKYLYAECTE
jgi:hypothetical protein